MAPIEINGLSKRFGRVQAVQDLSFEVQPGRITGFLGPNGAGKSTTIRILLGLVHPNRGTARFDGRRYEQLPHASGHVGAVLEGASFHPGRSGRNHLRVLAAAGRHPDRRVDEVLEQVGLSEAANRRVKGYSMGMRQRLGIAAALLGEPEVLILDEPTNGLDPPGIRWMRDLIRDRADRGNAVLISSHLLSEVEHSVDDVVVISRGNLRAAGPLESVLGSDEGALTRVRAGERGLLLAALRGAGLAAEEEPGGALLVRADPEEVGIAARDAGVALSELAPVSRSLEEAFLDLTDERAATAAEDGAAGDPAAAPAQSPVAGETEEES